MTAITDADTDADADFDADAEASERIKYSGAENGSWFHQKPKQLCIEGVKVGVGVGGGVGG